MNKDKIIKDLKERNDKLKNQYQLQEIRLHSLEYKNNKQKELLDKIKEYCNNRLQYYNEMRIDYMREFDGYAENDNENILELLEEIE